MLTMIFSAYNTLKENKTIRKIVIVVSLVILLVLGGYWGYSKIYNNGYNSGVNYQTEQFNAQQKKAKEYLDEEQKKVDLERASLNSEISSLKDSNAKLKNEIDKKHININKQVIDYEKSSEGVSSCFKPNSSGLRIINQSFPDSN